MKSILIDINAFAINLVEDHPGYTFIEPVISAGLAGQYFVKILDIVPFRAYWILTKKWKIDKNIAKNVIEKFIQTYPQIEYFGLDHHSLKLAFEYSTKLNHDIYDCYYLSGVITSNCDSILTTDQDFSKLTPKLAQLYQFQLDYINPVPNEILTQFSAYKM